MKILAILVALMMLLSVGVYADNDHKWDLNDDFDDDDDDDDRRHGNSDDDDDEDDNYDDDDDDYQRDRDRDSDGDSDDDRRYRDSDSDDDSQNRDSDDDDESDDDESDDDESDDDESDDDESDDDDERDDDDKNDDSDDNHIIDTNSRISRSEAIRIAQQQAVGSVDRIEQEFEDGRLVWNVRLLNGDEQSDIRIDVDDGDVLRIRTQETDRDSTQSGSTTRNRYTLAQVAEHDAENDCWVAVDGNVYDVTGFAPHQTLTCGEDNTDAYRAEHGSSLSRLSQYGIGEVGDTTTASSDTAVIVQDDVQPEPDDVDKALEDSSIRNLVRNFLKFLGIID